MTIRMLIVDDEPIICQGLRLTIPWETIGVEVAGEAYDGIEALQFVADEPIDLILTDIHMEGMDGLELAKKLKEKQPQIRIIILSGYDDFEYARRALRLGIEDYLLKPVNIDELMTMVQRIGQEIMQEAEKKHRNEQERRLKWLTELIQGEGTVQEGGDIPFLIADGVQSFRLIASQLEDYAGWAYSTPDDLRRSLRNQWEEAVTATLKGCYEEVVAYFHHPNLLICLCRGACQVSNLDLEAALLEAKVFVPDVPHLNFGISAIYANLEQAYPAYIEAVSVLQEKPISDLRTVMFYEEERVSRKIHQSHLSFAPSELEKQLLHVLFYGSYEELDDIIGRIVQDFHDKGCVLKEILQAIKELSIILQHKLRTNGIDLLGHADLFNAQKIDLLVHNSSRAMESLLRRELWSMFAIIHSSLEGKDHWIAERVKTYIDSRHTTDLKASEVAAWLKITPNYFSIIFKQNFGKGFAEYLNEVRIDHAKASLIETEERVFEIAEKVGYREYKYFCSIFKAYTGITPTQFRKLAQAPSVSLRPTAAYKR
ncbi:response regulator transcription factor [Paenibacillus agricola]|uniref:Response regulator n=1 Tax=Paenibacillus agricola TaxID=2716264 RepID=A0ABX0J757_9BACL|nr:response regulator [Paenibacillus agricola]NHN31443.1 response regulator [Paenibacillus agricola]